MLLLEFWKPIPGFDRHEASFSGKIRHMGKVIQAAPYVYEWQSPRILEGRWNGVGYIKMCISEYGIRHDIYAHVLVASAFIPNPDNLPEINHLNAIRCDNRVSNLERCTHKRNMEHAALLGRMKGKSKKKSPAQ